MIHSRITTLPLFKKQSRLSPPSQEIIKSTGSILLLFFQEQRCAASTTRGKLSSSSFLPAAGRSIKRIVQHNIYIYIWRGGKRLKGVENLPSLATTTTLFPSPTTPPTPRAVYENFSVHINSIDLIHFHLYLIWSLSDDVYERNPIDFGRSFLPTSTTSSDRLKAKNRIEEKKEKEEEKVMTRFRSTSFSFFPLRFIYKRASRSLSWMTGGIGFGLSLRDRLCVFIK